MLKESKGAKENIIGKAREMLLGTVFLKAMQHIPRESIVKPWRRWWKTSREATSSGQFRE